MVGQDGVAPPESEDNCFTGSPATTTVYWPIKNCGGAAGCRLQIKFLQGIFYACVTTP